MQAIEKLRNMVSWCEHHDKNFIDKFKSIKGLELAYNYAIANKLEFIDNSYIYSDNVSIEERGMHIVAISKFQKI